MPHALKPLLTIAAAICFLHNAYSQTDTSGTDLNLGRVKLKKDFTQSITIKGEQLEKMPFTSLEETLNAWMYGYFTRKGNILFIVDGLLINDVNAYSIYDIEEVTLVQNALTQINGADRQQQLIVIKTKRGGTAKQGLTVAGQASLISLGKKDNAATGVYHQYHVAVYKNSDRIQYGLSANYMHDVIPYKSDNRYKINTQPNIDRFRLNAWFTAQLGIAHKLYVRLNAVPQVNEEETLSIIPVVLPETGTDREQSKSDNWAISPSAGLRSTLFKGFTNDLSVAYLASNDKTEAKREVIQGSLGTQTSQQNVSYKRQQVLITEHISYRTTFNDWTLEPSLNFQFRYMKYDFSNRIQIYREPQQYSFEENLFNNEYRTYLLTTSVNLFYKNVLNIQGGAMTNISPKMDKGTKKVYPFITASANLIPVDGHKPVSVQVFASYAQTGNVGDYMRQTPDFITPFGYSSATINGIVYYRIPSTDSTWWNWQAGLQFGLLNKRIIVSYNFERRDFTAEVLAPTPMSGGSNDYVLYLPNINSSTHHFSINATVLDKATFHWTSGVTATSIKNKTKEEFTFYNQQFTIGDFNTAKASWTGGWINRFNWQEFTAGLDLVYYFIKEQPPYIRSKINALSLQSIYAGYKIRTKRVKSLEVYVNGRGLIQHNQYSLSGPRKYYGLGFKANI